MDRPHLVGLRDIPAIGRISESQTRLKKHSPHGPVSQDQALLTRQLLPIHETPPSCGWP